MSGAHLLQRLTAILAGSGSGLSVKLLGLLKRFRGPVVALAGVGAVLSGLLGYWNVYRSVAVATPAPTAGTAAPAAASDFSVVVLPFANQTGDAQKAYVADGLTVRITSALASWPDVHVVPAATAFSHKDKPLLLPQAAKEFGVRFVLNGSVLSSGEKLRISVQLSDAQLGKQLWSQIFDGELSDLFALQDKVTGRIGESLGRELVAVAGRDSDRRKSGQKFAELMLRVDAMGWDEYSREHLQKQESLYRQAMALEPDNPRPITGLAIALTMLAHLHYGDDSEIEKKWTEARELALKAKKLNSDFAIVDYVLGKYGFSHGDLLAARIAFETWMAKEPRNPYTYANMGWLLIRSGEPEKAFEMFSKATSLRPDRPFRPGIEGMCTVYLHLGDNDAALKWAIKTAQMGPDKFADVDLALAYMAKGEDAKAREIVTRLRRADPGLRISTYQDKPRPGDSAAYREFWEKKEVPALRKAGLPE